MGLVYKLAFRNILRNRRRSILTIVSMAGGYALLSFTLSLSEGSYNNMIELFTSDHTGHVQIHHADYLVRPSLHKTIDQADSLIQQISGLAGVKAVAPRIHGPSLAYASDKAYPANVTGVDPRLERETTLLADKVTAGRYLSETDKPNEEGYFPALVGKTLAKQLKLDLGDELILISQGADGSIANDMFEVVGIVGSKESNERNRVYLSLHDMRQFLSLGDQVHELAIRLEHHTLARGFSTHLANDPVLKQKIAEQALSIAPWQIVEAAFYNSMRLDKKGSYISMGILIFIVFIGVLNSILMAMLERTREFGVLRAIGTRPSMIFALIIIESVYLAFISCLIGLMVALPVNHWLMTTGFTLNEAIDMGGIMFNRLLGEMSWFVMVLPACVVMLSALLISLIPAFRAARVSPLKALQAV